MTQRGNGRRFLLESDADRRVYLDLLRENLALHEVLLVGYCVMSNHVHLIVIPTDAEGLALSMKHTHGRYASYWNVVHSSSGHAWQGRYFSCPLDGPHLWEALRYTELNPVRAHLVDEAQAWTWSSAAAHCGTVQADTFLSTELWQNHWNNADWREYLQQGKRNQSWPQSGSARIRVVLWARSSSSMLWKSRWIGDWFLGRAVGQLSCARMQDNQI